MKQECLGIAAFCPLNQEEEEGRLKVFLKGV